MSNSTSSSQPSQINLDNNANLYDTWAKTYDTDGNVLQMLDAIAFQETVIPLLSNAGDSNDTPPLKILELGCGTGRNTVLIKQHAPRGSTIFATDISQNMMDEAKRKIQPLEQVGQDSNSTLAPTTSIKWAIIDLQTQQKELQAFLADSEDLTSQSSFEVDALVSTLVLEHVELDAFFSVVGGVLKQGGWAWVTDMHPEMGGVSRAGFRKEDGTKIAGVSFNHGIEEKLESARKFGLELVGQVDAKGVGDDEGEAVKQYGDRARKWVGKKMFCGTLFRKV